MRDEPASGPWPLNRTALNSHASSSSSLSFTDSPPHKVSESESSPSLSWKRPRSLGVSDCFSNRVRNNLSISELLVVGEVQGCPHDSVSDDWRPGLDLGILVCPLPFTFGLKMVSTTLGWIVMVAGIVVAGCTTLAWFKYRYRQLSKAILPTHNAVAANRMSAVDRMDPPPRREIDVSAPELHIQPILF